MEALRDASSAKLSSREVAWTFVAVTLQALGRGEQASMLGVIDLAARRELGRDRAQPSLDPSPQAAHLLGRTTDGRIFRPPKPLAECILVVVAHRDVRVRHQA